MKKTLLMLLVLLSVTVASAHNITLLCWNNGKYSFSASQIPQGSAIVQVYSNNNYTGLIQTINLNVTGNSIVYWVNQPTRTQRVYVKVTWHDNYINKNSSGTNQCTTTPITFGPIDAKIEDDNTVITFQVGSTDESNSIVVNYNMPDGSIKKFPIVFLEKLYIGDIWMIVINNKTGKYTIKKK